MPRPIAGRGLGREASCFLSLFRHNEDLRAKRAKYDGRKGIMKGKTVLTRSWLLAAGWLVLLCSAGPYPKAQAQSQSQAQRQTRASADDRSSRGQSRVGVADPATASVVKTARHPLDPLEPDEIDLAVKTVRRHRPISESVRFVTVTLKEPPKQVVRFRADQNGAGVSREAFLILLDKATGRGYEAVVDLGTRSLTRYEVLPEGTQPPIYLDEFVECEEAVKRSPTFLAALKKRGIDDVKLVMVDAWSAGHYGNETPEEKGKRLSRALVWVRSEPTDNGYARPVEGIVAVVDLNRKEVLRIEDYGAVPLPPRPGNWARNYLGSARTDQKPLVFAQSSGPSFCVDGHEVKWQKWSFRVGFNPREGLVLHVIAYDGRPVLYRASIAEMIVPYADPREWAYRKNAFDMGEYGVGMLANSLALGCDCLGTIHYFDGHLSDSAGRPVTIKNAICLHEEDFGMLWKHTDWRINQSEVRRSRRLAVSLVATVGNYDYGYYWYFYQDGSIQMEVKLTGIMNTGALRPHEDSRYGAEVAPRLSAPLHQHFFCARLDAAIDGESNSLEEVNTQSAAAGPENPHGNAYFAESTPLLKESQAQRSTDPRASRFWRIINPNRPNGLGRPVAYRLCPGENVLPYALPDAAVLKRAGFLTKNLWVTPFDPAQRFPAGDYPNQSEGGDGLPRWTKADRDIANSDLVVWYTFGTTHVPRVEDWPVMPVHAIGFMLRPDGFFEANPALDVPPPP
jgi:primary-amine oxidase